MPAGRPPKPTRLKILEGDRGKRLRRRPAEPTPPEREFTPPEWLGEDGRAEWARVLDAQPPGLITAYDRGVLEVYAGALAEFRRAAELVVRTGPLVRGQRRGEPELVKNPAAQVARDQGRLVLQAAALLGIGPVARARLVSGAPPADVAAARDDVAWLFTAGQRRRQR